jgi:hypothetical protein
VNATYLLEKGIARSSKHEYEEDIARRWWALPINATLPLTNGESCRLIYAGRPGGSPGPDIRDAIVRFNRYHSGTDIAAASNYVENTIGDVEFHIRATDWFAHQHHTDVRYNNVVLHIVLICDRSQPTLRQDGTIIPTGSFNDIFPTTHKHHPVQWPCYHVMAQLDEEERTHIFTMAGTLRFEMKARIFFELLSEALPSEIFSTYDVCLIPALAEALGFGRDRAFFRAAGLHLIGAIKTIPDPLGRAPQPSPLDSSRLRVLRSLVDQWRNSGARETLRQALSPTPPNNAHLAALRQLRTIFHGLGTARADILICNIVLPFAAAVAQLENYPILAECARNLYSNYPGLPSNQITRAMYKQLLLKREPRGACQQQGLHFIYAQTCREKSCHACLIGKQVV